MPQAADTAVFTVSDGLTRRDFLHAGSLTALGLGLPALQALADSGSVARDHDLNCILLFLVGGPSQSGAGAA